MTIGVVGAGTMGAGIAEVVARSGSQVRLVDVDESALERGVGRLRQSLERVVERGKATREQADAMVQRIEPTTDLADLAGCEVVIEAVVEQLPLKQQLFGRLAEVCPPEALLATNTSSLSITEIGREVPGPERVVGLHFFNPPPVMGLVEVVRGVQTADTSVQRAVEVVRGLGKQPVVCADTPGFIVNRVARPFYLEALRLVGDGYAVVEEVDAALRGRGFRMGPFELIDLIGADVNFAVSQSVYTQFQQEPRFRPHPLQETLVRAGRLGRKSGVGYYDYGSDPPTPTLPTRGERAQAPEGPWADWEDDLRRGYIVGRVLASLVNEAYWALGQGVASREDVDLAMRLGTNWPQGPFEWSDELGTDRIRRSLRSLREAHGDAYLTAPALLHA